MPTCPTSADTALVFEREEDPPNLFLSAGSVPKAEKVGLQMDSLAGLTGTLEADPLTQGMESGTWGPAGALTPCWELDAKAAVLLAKASVGSQCLGLRGTVAPWPDPAALGPLPPRPPFPPFHFPK